MNTHKVTFQTLLDAIVHSGNRIVEQAGTKNTSYF